MESFVLFSSLPQRRAAIGLCRGVRSVLFNALIPLKLLPVDNRSNSVDGGKYKNHVKSQKVGY